MSQPIYPIVDGPTKWELILGLCDPKPMGKMERLVPFRVEDGNTFSFFYVLIETLGRQDVSGATWKFQGVAYKNMERIPHEAVAKQVEGVFNLNIRGGHLTVLDSSST